MASTMPSRHVRQKPNTLERPPQVIERTTKEGRRLRYELKVIQQPERARACGSGAKCKTLSILMTLCIARVLIVYSLR